MALGSRSSADQNAPNEGCVSQPALISHPIPFGSFVLTFWVAAAVVALWASPATLSRG